MANMTGKSRFPLDTALILRDTAAAPVTADLALAPWPLVSKGAYWQNPADVHDGTIYVVGTAGINVGATLSLDIYTAEDAAGTNSQLYASYPQANGSVFEIPLDEISMLKTHAAATYFYVEVNVGGTSPSASVFAYLAPKPAV